MSPLGAPLNFGHLCLRNAKVFGDVFLKSRHCFNCFCLVFCKFRASVLFTRSISAFALAVLHVVPARALTKVVRIDALRIVARMHYIQFVIQHALEQKV